MANQVFIDGDTDAIQLRVQANPVATGGQSNPLQTWEDENGVTLAQVSEDGRFEAGDMSLMTTDESLIEAHEQGTSASVIQRGVNTLGKFTGAITNAVTWVMSELQLLGGGAISGIHTALRAKLVHDNDSNDSSGADLRAGDFEAVNQSGSSGTPVGDMTGVQGRVDNQTGAYLTNARSVAAQIVNGSGADIEKAAAFEVLPPENPGGTIDTLIGLEIGDITVGTDNYAIRTGTGKVQLGELTAGLIKSDANGVLSNVGTASDAAVEMTGATPTTDGATGLVPQPLAGQDKNFLRGDGTWATPSGGAGGSSAYVKTVDPTIGENLAAGYQIGDTWVNTTLNKSWMLVDEDSDYVTTEYAESNRSSLVALKASGSGDVQTSTASGTSHRVGDMYGGEWICAQGFQMADGGVLSGFTFTLLANSGTPAGDMQWEIRTDSGGSGPASTALMSGVIPNASIVPSAENTVTVTNGVYLAASIPYWLLLKSTVPEATNVGWNWKGVSTGGVYAGGYMANSSNNEASWFLNTNWDMAFSVTTSAITTRDKLAQSFEIAVADSVKAVEIYLRKTGVPSGNLTLKIYPDSAGNPAGTPVTNGISNTIAAESLSSSSYDFVRFEFSTQPNLNANTHYHLVLETSDPASNTDIIEWGFDNTSPGYTDGEMKSQSSGAWSSEDGDAVFKVIMDGGTWELLNARSVNGLVFVDPTQHDWIPLNHGNGDYVIDKSNKLMSISGVGVTANHVRGWYKSAPTPPYVITACCTINAQQPASNQNLSVCLFFRDSATDALQVLSYGIYNSYPGFVHDTKWNSPTGYNSQYIFRHWLPSMKIWLRIEDDNTYRKTSLSADGHTYHALNSVARTDFLTADEIGFGIRLNASPIYPIQASLLSWEES